MHCIPRGAAWAHRMNLLLGSCQAPAQNARADSAHLMCSGSEMMREIVWVVFDEIHYMQDRERGVVWEETIIGLPDACRMVFLSATLSNAREFAAWVASLHKQPCHVVYTDYRPTPLEHFAMPCTTANGEGSKGGLYKMYTKDGAQLASLQSACLFSAPKHCVPLFVQSPQLQILQPS